MKKSLLAAGALAALGGLGFSGAAHAVWAVDAAGTAAATKLRVATDNGLGHILLTPYFSTASGNNTLLSVVNTDSVNAKAVKVRFRGAANSDDVLDFTVFLSPDDVWTGSVTQNADGLSELVSPDNSCVLPGKPTAANPGTFRTFRLDASLDAATQAMHTQEGYVEWLNMADIKPGSTLFNTVLHPTTGANKGMPDCDTTTAGAALMNALISDDVAVDPAQTIYGFAPPSGQLMGNWTIVNSGNATSYGGSSTAVAAVTEDDVPTTGRLFFAPQAGHASARTAETADPLLVGGKDRANNPVSPPVGLMALDLPDLSTPYVQGVTDADVQADSLSAALAAATLMNEWTAGVSDGVTFSTDWVFSQPTRRYHASINYFAKDASGKVVPAAMYATDSATYYTAAQTVTNPKGSFGTELCLAAGQANLTMYDREEFTYTKPTSGDWSPVPPVQVAPGFCGEVATLTFGQESKALNAALTNTKLNMSNMTGGAGWAKIVMKNPLPVVGFAANYIAAGSGNGAGNWGDAVTHRYIRPVAP